MKNLKRNLSIILVIVMVAAMTMTACGSKNEESKESESVESKTPDTEKVADEEEEVEEELAESSDEVTEEDIVEVKEAIKESVISEYLEPNGIAAESFTWPPADSECWTYYNQLVAEYAAEKFEEAPESGLTYISPSAEKSIVEAAYDGVLNWYEDSENYNYNYFNSAVLALPVDVITAIDFAE